DQPVSLRLDGGSATVLRTDAAGTACLPLSLAPGRHAVTATYAGSRSWAPASERTTVTVTAPPRRPPPAPRPAPRPPDEAYRAGLSGPQTGIAGVQAPAHPAPAPQAAAQGAY